MQSRAKQSQQYLVQNFIYFQMAPVNIAAYSGGTTIFGPISKKSWPKCEKSLNLNQKSAFISSPLRFFAS